MKLIIVSGATATGKTTLATRISDKLGYQLLSKDSFKEALYNREKKDHGYFWYEKVSKDKFYLAIERMISAGNSVVIENNFMKRDKIRLKALIKEDKSTYEIYCTSRGLARFRRFRSRAQYKRRHIVHKDRLWYPTVLIGCLLNNVGIDWPYGPTGTAENIIWVNTTDVSDTNYDSVFKFIE